MNGSAAPHPDEHERFFASVEPGGHPRISGLIVRPNATPTNGRTPVRQINLPAARGNEAAL